MVLTTPSTHRAAEGRASWHLGPVKLRRMKPDFSNISLSPSAYHSSYSLDHRFRLPIQPLQHSRCSALPCASGGTRCDQGQEIGLGATETKTTSQTQASGHTEGKPCLTKSNQILPGHPKQNYNVLFFGGVGWGGGSPGSYSGSGVACTVVKRSAIVRPLPLKRSDCLQKRF